MTPQIWNYEDNYLKASNALLTMALSIYISCPKKVANKSSTYVYHLQINNM